MVLSILWLASVPTVGYGDHDVGPLRRGKLQEYVAEALAQTKVDLANSKAGSQGHSFGSPVSSPPLPAELSSLRLPPPPACGAPGAAQQPHGKQPRRRGRRHSPASEGEQHAVCSQAESSREISSPTAGVSSPTAITSPHASDGTASLSSGRTAAHTPDSAATSLDSAPGALLAAAAAAEQLAGPVESPASSAASSASEPKTGDDSRSSSSVGRLTPSPSFYEGPQADRLLIGALTAGEPGVDMRGLIQQLREPRLTGQVCAWGWEQAACISHRQRSMPTELFMALWAATEATAGRFFPQDVLALLEAWLTLLQTCPRHFRLRVPVVESLAVYSIPPVVKRMTERQLGQLASLCCQVALHRCENGYGLVSSGQGPSARDLMQPIFALVAAELAWRCANKMRYVSVETLGAVGRAATAWRWEVVRHRDSRQLAALKESTAEALAVLQGHLPQ